MYINLYYIYLSQINIKPSISLARYFSTIC